MQMIGQRGTGQPGGCGQFAYRKSFVTGLHQQSEQVEAVFLGERID